MIKYAVKKLNDGQGPKFLYRTESGFSGNINDVLLFANKAEAEAHRQMFITWCNSYGKELMVVPVSVNIVETVED